MTTTSCRRSALLRALDETTTDRRTGRPTDRRRTERERPWDDLPDVWTVFADEDDLLRAVQQRWFTSLLASVEQAIEVGGGDLVGDVRRAYRDAARRHPGLRRILDTHDGHPAIARSVRREHAVLAGAAGVERSEQVTGRRPAAAHPEPVAGARAAAAHAEPVAGGRQTAYVPSPRRSTFARFLSYARD